jgi:hypothetical protein
MAHEIVDVAVDPPALGLTRLLGEFPRGCPELGR